MNRSPQLLQHLKEHRLIALLSPRDTAACLRAYEILTPLGIILEIALRTEHALPGIRLIREKHPEALVMAGTVMTAGQAQEAVKAGAAGIVSADYHPDVVAVCVGHGILCAPGGLADAGKQLVQKAELLGCSLDELRHQYPYQWIYKLFPAAAAGCDNSGLAKAWRGPYTHLYIIYTGGVSLENLAALDKQDPRGIFCSSSLTRDIDDPEKMEKTARAWLSILKPAARNPAPARKRTSSPAPRVVTCGEIMLRLSPPGNRRFVQTDTFDVSFGGAEANVAVALAGYGLPSRFVSALPDNEIGQSAVNALRAYGVDTGTILRQGRRTGIYFLEHGASQRPSKVIYDRSASAMAEIRPRDVDWPLVFEDAAWFHWSGITPALSDSAAETIAAAVRAAKAAGLTVSVDLNYRAKLWTKEKAASVMSPLMEHTDICIGNEEDADAMFGITTRGTDLDSGTLDPAAFEETAKQLTIRFGFKKAAITLRESLSASENDWSACLYNGKNFMTSKKYTIHLVDRVGGGDSFSSGLIYALLSGMPDQEALEFGVAASCLKQTIPGDFNLVTADEAARLAAGAVSGRVRR